LRKFLIFVFLAALRLAARPFYRARTRWVGEVPPNPWQGIRIVCLLHHTSLFEWLYLIGVPWSFLWRVSRHGVVPAAEKTLNRPVIGWFFRSLAANVVSITRERDHTWKEVLASIDPDSMVMILPEGRMMRRTGLDSHGQPMTVRGGIADILDAIPDGRMLIAYSGGLHHVQAPGDGFPRLFRSIRLNLEAVDIADYRAARRAEAGTSAGFKRAVVDDLGHRRDLHCPIAETGSTAPAAAG